jgi:hypothetical protein
MSPEVRAVTDAVGVFSAILEAKVRKARVCGCGACKSEAQAYTEWLSAEPAKATPPARETWWK